MVSPLPSTVPTHQGHPSRSYQAQGRGRDRRLRQPTAHMLHMSQGQEQQGRQPSAVTGYIERDRACQHCGKHPISGYKYCSIECRKRAKGVRPANPVPICTCKGCGKAFKPGGRDRMTYCSRQCAATHKSAVVQGRRAAVRQERYAPKPCIVCATVFTPSNVLQSCCSNPCRERWAETRATESYVRRHPRASYRCAECGIDCIPQYGIKSRAYCSDACARRHGRRIGKAVRRARIKGVSFERVDPLAVFNRDGWRCQLCGEKTPKRLRGTIKARAPELDHIIPIAAGGEHSYRNTQCACRSCNQDKGAEIRGQLRLVG
jgi:hypothetical protein